MPTQKNREYGAPMGDTEPTSSAGRPQAGDADDATRSQKLKERLAEKEPVSSTPAPVKPASAKPAPNTDIASGVDELIHPGRRTRKAIQDAGG